MPCERHRSSANQINITQRLAVVRIVSKRLHLGELVDIGSYLRWRDCRQVDLIRRHCGDSQQLLLPLKGQRSDESDLAV
ncbi:MAG: hypothetical protein WBD20_09825 [Pirellulaceae bacterium]